MALAIGRRRSDTIAAGCDPLQQLHSRCSMLDSWKSNIGKQHYHQVYGDPTVRATRLDRGSKSYSIVFRELMTQEKQKSAAAAAAMVVTPVDGHRSNCARRYNHSTLNGFNAAYVTMPDGQISSPKIIFMFLYVALPLPQLQHRKEFFLVNSF